MGLTWQLAEFAAGLAFDAIPGTGVQIATLGFVDCFAVAIAGGTEPVVEVLTRTLLGGAERQESSLFHCGLRTAAPTAAWINGAAAHALDYDDAPGHRSAVLVPALLAEGEALGATGQDMIAAYVAGYEIWAELAEREKGHLHEKGWHPTGVYGTIAAAAAVARLHRLGPEQTQHALGIAASEAGGLVANFGSMVKPFHAGNAARAGILAARLAKNGLQASPNVLEHERGFLSAVSQHGDVDRESPPSRLGTSWRIVRNGLSIKRYPTCYCTHRSIDAMLDLARESAFRATDVEIIDVHLGKTQAAILHNHRPTTVLQAKFSIEFAMACALIEQRVTLEELNDTVVNRPDIQRLVEKVRVTEIDEYDPQLQGYSAYDEVIVTARGRDAVSSGKIRRAKGHISHPLDRAELLQKFTACLRFAHASLDPERAFSLLENLQSQPAGWMRDLGLGDSRRS